MIKDYDWGWFKSAKNFICQQNSDTMGKIDNIFFQYLALPKDPQSFCPYVAEATVNSCTAVYQILKVS